MKNRTVGFDSPVNIYEIHAGSWRKKGEGQDRLVYLYWACKASEFLIVKSNQIHYSYWDDATFRASFWRILGISEYWILQPDITLWNCRRTDEISLMPATRTISVWSWISCRYILPLIIMPWPIMMELHFMNIHIRMLVSANGEAATSCIPEARSEASCSLLRTTG